MMKHYRTAAPARLRRTWRALLCALAIVGLSMPMVAFGRSLDGTFVGKATGRDVSFSRNGKPLSDWAGTLKFRLDSGEDLLVFCIQIDVRVSSGDRYRSDGAVIALPNGCKIRYLLDAYPASTARDVDEAAARQMAIWVFSDGVDPATIADAKVRDRTIALVDEAAGKPCPKRRTDAPDLTIAPLVASAAVGQVVTYTVRASPADAGQPVAITLSGPAVLADASDASTSQQQTIALSQQSAATVQVLITGAGPASITAALPYRLEAGTVYSQIDDRNPTQRLVLAESRDLVARASAQLAGAAASPPPAERTPAPAPTPPPAEQTATPAPTPPPGATTPAQTPPPDATAPPATRQPSHDATPTPAEQITATAVISEEVGAAPAASAQAGSAAAAVSPLTLPNTGGPAGPPIGLGLAGVALLLAGGWLRRRQLRRAPADRI